MSKDEIRRSDKRCFFILSLVGLAVVLAGIFTPEYIGFVALIGMPISLFLIWVFDRE